MCAAKARDQALLCGKKAASPEYDSKISQNSRAFDFFFGFCSAVSSAIVPNLRLSLRNRDPLTKSKVAGV